MSMVLMLSLNGTKFRNEAQSQELIFFAQLLSFHFITHKKIWKKYMFLLLIQALS